MKYKRQASQILFTDLIESSFRNGNAEQLKSFLSDELELVIDSEKVNFNKISKDHAGFILTSFFKKNPPVKFAYVYQGQTPEKLKYSVGNYQTTNKEFIIYMLLSESKKGDPLIKKLQFREN
jgi:hypothetical protein